MPPLKKEGHIALHMSVRPSIGTGDTALSGHRYFRSRRHDLRFTDRISVSLNLVQLITQEGFSQKLQTW